MRDVSSAAKFISKAEKVIQDCNVSALDDKQLIEMCWKVRMKKASLLMELNLYEQALKSYEKAFECKQQMLLLRIKEKMSLPNNAPSDLVDWAQYKIEQSVCRLSVLLLNMCNAWEQVEQLEKSMECLRLVYWFSANYIKQLQYSDLLNEIIKQHETFTTNYDELMLINGEIHKMMLLALGKRSNDRAFHLEEVDEEELVIRKKNQDFLSFVNEHLYEKSEAKQFNSLVIINKTPRVRSDDAIEISSRFIDSTAISNGAASVTAPAASFSATNLPSSPKNVPSLSQYYVHHQNLVKANQQQQAQERKDMYFSKRVTTFKQKETIQQNDDSNSSINSFLAYNTITNNTSSNQLEYQTPRMNNNNNLNNIPSSNSIPDTNSKQQQQHSHLAESTLKVLQKDPSNEKLQLSSTTMNENNAQTITTIDEQTKSKKTLQQQKRFSKYQPRLVSNVSYFLDYERSYDYDSQNLLDESELEVQKVFGIKKKQKYNILDHDVQSFADDFAIREILASNAVMPYAQIKSLTEKNMSDHSQEKNEYQFCKRMLTLKKQTKPVDEQVKSSSLRSNSISNSKSVQSEGNLRIIVKSEVNDIMTTLSTRNQLNSHKKKVEEANRILSLNLDRPDEVVQASTSSLGLKDPKAFKRSLSKKLTVEGSLRKIVEKSNQMHKQRLKTFLEKSTQINPKAKRIYFFEEQEELYLDDTERLKQTQTANKQTIQMQLSDLDIKINNANKQIEHIKRNRVNSGMEQKRKKERAPEIKEGPSIGECIARQHKGLSSSVKQTTQVRSSDRRLNSFLEDSNARKDGRIRSNNSFSVRTMTVTPRMPTLQEVLMRTSKKISQEYQM